MGNLSVIECQECGKSLAANARSCKCGWKGSGGQLVKKKMQVECVYPGCPLPGSVSPETRGDRWFCQYHWQCHDDRLLSDAVLENIRKNYSKIMDARQQGFILKL